MSTITPELGLVALILAVLGVSFMVRVLSYLGRIASLLEQRVPPVEPRAEPVAQPVARPGVDPDIAAHLARKRERSGS